MTTQQHVRASILEVQTLNDSLCKFQRGVSSVDISSASDMLGALKTLDMSTMVLKETKIGQTVSKLRKHPNDRISIRAKDLLKQWKAIARSPRASLSKTNDNMSLVTTTSGVISSSPNNSASCTPAAIAASASSSRTSASDVTADVGAIQWTNQTSLRKACSNLPMGLNTMRTKVLEKLIEILGKSSAAAAARQDIIQSAAIEIEAAMAHKYAMHTAHEDKKEYSNKYRTLLFNLKKNAVLVENVLSGLVVGEQLIDMTPDELATDERRAEVAKLRDDAFQRSRLDWAEANADKINEQCGITDDTGLFTCGRCKSSKTSNTQKQTRSADEPMTVFVMCRNCGNRWKC